MRRAETFLLSTHYMFSWRIFIGLKKRLMWSYATAQSVKFFISDIGMWKLKKKKKKKKRFTCTVHFRIILPTPLSYIC